MRLIKVIQIDPFACTIKMVEFDGNDHRNIYPLLSHEVHPVDTFTSAPVDILKGQDVLFVDDNGLLNNPVRWFTIAGGHQPFAGKGLILGGDEEGESQSCETHIDIVRMSTRFAERDKFNPRKLVPTTTPWQPEQPRPSRFKEAPKTGQGFTFGGGK